MSLNLGICTTAHTACKCACVGSNDIVTSDLFVTVCVFSPINVYTLENHIFLGYLLLHCKESLTPPKRLRVALIHASSEKGRGIFVPLNLLHSTVHLHHYGAIYSVQECKITHHHHEKLAREIFYT